MNSQHSFDRPAANTLVIFNECIWFVTFRVHLFKPVTS